MTGNERKILKRLDRGPAYPVALIRFTGVGPRALSLTLLALQERGWVDSGRLPGEPYSITPDGHLALLDHQDLKERLARKLVCGTCFRPVIHPFHWVLRLTGWCDGKGAWM